MHDASEEDELRYSAEREATEAKRLYAVVTSESRRHALEYRLQSLAIWSKLGDLLAEAASHAAAGDALHRLSEFEEACGHYRQALEIFRSTGDRRGEGEMLNNLGLSYWQTGELNVAVGFFEAANAVWEELGFTFGEAAVLTNRGLLEWESGEFAEAIDDHMRAAKLFEALGAAGGRGFALNNAAVALESLGDFRRARDNLHTAIPLFHSAKNSLAEGRARVRLARILLHDGSTIDALLLARDARPMLHTSGDLVAEAEALMVLGEVNSKLRRRDAAIPLYQDALSLFRRANRPRGVIDALLASGAESQAMHQRDQARHAFEEASDISRKSGFADVETESLRWLALIERQDKEWARAQEHLEAAINLAEKLRLHAPPGALRLSWFAEKQPLYLDYIDVLAERNRRTHDSGLVVKAFETSERMRARSLLEGIAADRAQKPGAVDPALSRKERLLKARMNFWYSEMEKASAPHLETTRQKFEDTRAEYSDVESGIRSSLLQSGDVTQFQPATLAEIQSKGLEKGVLLLSFLPGESRSYLWAVTNGDLKMFELPAGHLIEAAAEKLHALISVPPRTDSEDLYHESARDLSRMLLNPIARLLAGRKLVIIGGGYVQQIPFAVLPDPMTGLPLIQEHEITMLPSASTLVLERRRAVGRKRPPRSMVLFADPVYSGDDPRLGTNALPGITGVKTFPASGVFPSGRRCHSACRAA